MPARLLAAAVSLVALTSMQKARAAYGGTEQVPWQRYQHQRLVEIRWGGSRFSSWINSLHMGRLAFPNARSSSSMSTE
jgi:hypothetical protein